MSQLFAFTMPKWGIEMQEGTISEWHLSAGVGFSKGQVLASVETDKIVNDIEAEFDGHCLHCLANEGDTLNVGELLAVFGDASTSAHDIERFISGFVPADTAASGEESDDSHKATADTQRSSTSASVAQPETPSLPHPGPELISERAWIAANQHSIDISTIAGSGRNGRIQLQDIEQVIKPRKEVMSSAYDNAVPPEVNEYEGATPLAVLSALDADIDIANVVGTGRKKRVLRKDVMAISGQSMPGKLSSGQTIAGQAKLSNAFVPFTGMRGKIASRLTTAWQKIPHYHLQMVVRADKLLLARQRLNQSQQHQQVQSKVSVNDCIVAGVSRALERHPSININVSDEGITQFDQANIAIAVAVEEGLITPVVKSAQTLSVKQISHESRRLIDASKAKHLSLTDLSSGTFTVSNLGMFGVSNFTAVINPPQGAILSVGAVSSDVIEEAGKMVIAKRMILTLGCDHRAIDGAMGAQFLAELKTLLENPEWLETQ